MVTVRYIKPINLVLTHRIDPILWNAFISFDLKRFEKRLHELKIDLRIIVTRDLFGKNILHYILESPNENHLAFSEVLLNFMYHFPAYSNIHNLSKAICNNKNNCLHFITFSGDLRKLNLYKDYLLKSYQRGMMIIKKLASSRNSHNQLPTSNNELMNRALTELRTPTNSPTASAATPVSAASDVKNSDVKKVQFKPICYLGVDKNFYNPLFPSGFFFTHFQEETNQLYLDQKHFDDKTMLEELTRFTKS